MKKSKTIWIIIAGVLLAGGLMLLGVAFALTGGDLEKLSTEEKWVEKQYTASAEDIHKIAAVEKNMRIVLEPSVDSNIHITYFESDTETCQIEETPDGTLEIQRQSSKKWYQRIGVMLLFGRGQNRRLEIAIPDGLACDIHAESTNGSITVGNLTVKGLLTLSTTNGKISAEALKTTADCTLTTTNAQILCKSLTAEGSLSILTKNGRVDITGCNSGEAMMIYTTNAAVNLEDIQAGGEVRVSTTNGSLTAEALQARALEAETRNGRLTLTDTVTEESTYAETTNSSLKIHRIKAGDNIHLQSSNGAVKGSIKGKLSDYSITSKTSNAESNLPAHGGNGDKLLEVHTSNGDIDIEFIDPLSES